MIRSLVLLVLCGAVVAVVAVGHGRPELLTRGTGLAGSVTCLLPPPFAGRQLLRLVLIGADDRQERGRSDTLMVLYLNAQGHRAGLLSVPRDLLVEIPGHRASKINHAYNYGGPELTVRTVEGLLGEPTDGHLVINFQGFVKAVDALGGVDLEVEDCEGRGRGMNYDCPQDGLVIHLKPGRQHLTGYKAMGYVRYRKSNIPGAGCNDFERAARQQKLLRALVAQKLKPSHWRQLLAAGRQVWQCLHTTLTWRQGVDLARCLAAMKPGDLRGWTIPAADERRHGVYYARLDDARLQAVRAELATHLAAAPQPLVRPSAEVLNASGRRGVAMAAAEKLRAAGFRITQVGNAPHFGQEHTVVLYRGKGKNVATRVTQVLGCGVLEYDDSGPAPPDHPQVQIQIGRDFTGG